MCYKNPYGFCRFSNDDGTEEFMLGFENGEDIFDITPSFPSKEALINHLAQVGTTVTGPWPIEQARELMNIQFEVQDLADKADEYEVTPLPRKEARDSHPIDNVLPSDA